MTSIQEDFVGWLKIIDRDMERIAKIRDAIENEYIGNPPKPLRPRLVYESGRVTDCGTAEPPNIGCDCDNCKANRILP